MIDSLQGDATPTAVTFTDEEIIVTLSDGRKISNPLAWFPLLASATPTQRANYTLYPWSIDWDDLNEGVDIEGMLRGIRPKHHSEPI